MNLPTIRQLRYFAALAEHKHFGRAARSCFVSQSAFSNAIQELEKLLGVGLVDRTNRRVTITNLGEDFAARSRSCLRDIESLVEFAQRSAGSLTGPLKLGVIPTIAPFLLPKVLPDLRKDFPDLKVFLHEGTTENIYQRLMAGELDLILVALPYDLRNTEVMSLFKDRFLLASRINSKLIDPKKFKPSQLETGTVLLLEDGHCLRDHALAACKIRNTEKVNQYAASSLLTLVEMVNADIGITFLPEMAKGSALLESTRIKMYPLSDRSYREIGLVWRRGSSRGEEFRMLGKYFKKKRKQ